MNLALTTRRDLYLIMSVLPCHGAFIFISHSHFCYSEPEHVPCGHLDFMRNQEMTFVQNNPYAEKSGHVKHTENSSLTGRVHTYKLKLLHHFFDNLKL